MLCALDELFASTSTTQHLIAHVRGKALPFITGEPSLSLSELMHWKESTVG
jgi:hypothetical protein